MDQNKINKYKKIYRTEVLPKKSVTINTVHASKATEKLFYVFSDLRKGANQVVLGCDVHEKKR